MSSQSVNTRRAFLIKAFNTGLLATVTSSALLSSLVNAMAEVPAELPLGQSIYNFEGEVTVDGTIITKANMSKTVIRANSVVVTGQSSWIMFAIGKDAHHLRENSRLVLESTGVFEEAMRLFTGSVLSVFAKRKPTEKQFKLHTTTATVGIRGTAVYAESDTALNRSYVCTCYGEVDVSAIADPSISENIKSAHHDNPRYIYADTSQGDIIQAAPMKNHADAELSLIEAIVGRTTPF